MCLVLVLVKVPRHRLLVRTYLRHALSLQPGTPVSIDGVRVGSVRSVELVPGVRDRPVEVLMTLGTAYKLTLPNDSVVEPTSEGVLGPTVMEIDTRNTTGSPLESNGVLKSVEITDTQGARALEVIGNALIEESKKLRDKN